jgi:hypothetical protein
LNEVLRPSASASIDSPLDTVLTMQSSRRCWSMIS